MSRRPPLLGEHNSEVYSELGFSKNDLVQLARDDIILSFVKNDRISIFNAEVAELADALRSGRSGLTLV